MAMKTPVFRLLARGRIFPVSLDSRSGAFGPVGQNLPLLPECRSTSVFTSIWELLGFQVSWPFAFSSIPNEGISMGVLGGFLHLADRLVRMFFAPLGDDMDHVIITWGTGLFLLCLTAAICWGRQAAKKKETRLFWTILFVVSTISIVSIYLLWQVDGNYFMLWYSLGCSLRGCRSS